jgi:iron complex transport system substrate-binding protein
MKRLTLLIITLFISFATAQSVTIEHKYGSTTIESLPQRIVTVGAVEQDALLALGIVPLGVTEWFGTGLHENGIWPWARARLDELGGELPMVVGNTSTGIDVERVLALEPDLILGLYSALSAEQYAQLSKIAPTIAQPLAYGDWGVPWQELTRIIGQAVGKSAEAEAVITKVEARFAAVQQAHPEFVGATAVVATPYQGIWVYGEDDLRGQLLADLGFRLPEGLSAFTEGSFGGNISMERVDLLDVDAIIWLDANPDQEPLASPLYRNLRVHREGREVFLESYTDSLGAATSFVTSLSIPYLLDGLVPMLAAAIDGDPATLVRAASGR